MPTITADDAERNFAQVLRQVREGMEFTVTEGGEPVARVSSAIPIKARPQQAVRNPEEIFQRIDKIGARQKLEGASIRDLVEEGRRF